MGPKVDDAYRDQQRQEILRIALRVFAQKGFALASMQDVVNATGKSRGRVYLYFSSKDDLANALFEHLSRGLAAELVGMAQDQTSTWSALERFIDQTAATLTDAVIPDEHAFAIEFVMAARAQQRAQDLALSRYQAVIGQLTDLIEAGVARGEIRPTAEPCAIASALIAFLDGLSHHRYFLGAEHIHTASQIAAFKSGLRAMLGA